MLPAVREHHAAGNTLADEAIGQEHPHTPASPGVLKAAGPAATAADKARDAVAGRGTG
jgi:hypothetical protein